MFGALAKLLGRAVQEGSQALGGQQQHNPREAGVPARQPMQPIPQAQQMQRLQPMQRANIYSNPVAEDDFFFPQGGDFQRTPQGAVVRGGLYQPQNQTNQPWGPILTSPQEDNAPVWGPQGVQQLSDLNPGQPWSNLNGRRRR